MTLNRFQAHQFNKERAEQSRWIWTRITFSSAALVLAVVAFVLRPTWYLLYAPAFTLGVVGSINGFIMLFRMPDPEPPSNESWRMEQATRPMMQTTERQLLPVNWQRIISAEQWARFRFFVRRGDYYISREKVGYPAGLSSEQFRDLRAELIRCGVLPRVGNYIVDSEQARAVFSPAPTHQTGKNGPS